MKMEGPPVSVPPESDGGITIHNRLHLGHRYQAVMDEVLRVALRGLSGTWEISVYAVGRAWFRIDVVAPDGASWFISVPVHEGPRAEDLAGMARAACVRHSRLTPGDIKTEEVRDEADDAGEGPKTDGTRTAGPPNG